MYDLKVGIIGTGFQGKKLLAVYQRIGATVVLCSTDVAVGKALAEENGCKFYTDYKEMFQKEGLDCVSVCVPTFLHHQVVMDALDYNIAVLCEKPFASNVEQAREMVQKAKEKNVLLMVGQTVRFDKSYKYLKDCIDDQRFGKLLSLTLVRHGSVPHWSIDGWLTDISRSGGTLSDLHIHDTDMMVNLLGLPKSVITTGSPCACHTTYRYEGDAAITAAASWRPVKSWHVGYDASFEKANIRFNVETHKDVTLYTADGPSFPLQTEPAPEFFESGNATENELNYFCHCVVNHAEPTLCHPEDTLKTMMVNCAEVESLKEQKEIVI